MIYFTSDHHFGHKNIIEYCNRPFPNVDIMDEQLIKNWNDTVNLRDIVYHLGDFCLGEYEQAGYYFSRLNGNIYILSNKFHHDKNWIKTSYEPFVNGDYRRPLVTKNGEVYLFDPIEVLDFKEIPAIIVLSHYPQYVWDKKHYLSWHLYGHIHDKRFEIPNSPLSYNVGVDLNNFTPVSLNYIVNEMKTRIKEYDLKSVKRGE